MEYEEKLVLPPPLTSCLIFISSPHLFFVFPEERTMHGLNTAYTNIKLHVSSEQRNKSNARIQKSQVEMLILNKILSMNHV